MQGAGAAEFHSGSYPSLEASVKEFLAKLDQPVDRACFAVAGPVIDGHVKMTNLPWEVDEARWRHELGLTSVHLIHDLEAIARAVPILKPDDVHAHNSGEPVPGGTIAVIATGTGLGKPF